MNCTAERELLHENEFGRNRRAMERRASLSSSRLSKRHSFNQRAYNPRPVFRVKIGILEIAAVCTGQVTVVRAITFIYPSPERPLCGILFDLKVPYSRLCALASMTT